MKRVSQFLTLLASLTLLAPALAKSDKYCHEEIVKYVQATAAPNGNGSKKHPFSSLAAAALATWDVLIVLPSTMPLGGGITLNNGQKIIGACNPTDISLSPTQPIITNLNGTLNNGVGVIATGDNLIKNIYFQNTYSSAINYDNAKNLTVQDCLITGHNQGNVIVDHDENFPDGLSAAGIQGKNGNAGETLIDHVIIRNNANGFGLTDYTTNAVRRELTVCNCEFATLNRTGIFTPLTGTNTSSNIVVKDSYFHDITGGDGISCEPFSGATESILVKSSLFDNINAPAIGTNTISGSELKLIVEACSFENGTSGAISITNSSLKSEASIENSVSTNVGTFFASQVQGNGVQYNRLCGNTVTGGTFYEAGTNATAVKPVEITEITGNCFTGLTGIELNPQIAWTLLDITAECNCFFGSGTGSICFDTITATPIPGPFNGLINAHENTFSGFTTDIKDNGSNVSYLVSRNFWGTSTQTCTTTSPCPKFQTCDHGSCLGPIVVAPAPPYTGLIDASHPLAASIKCPKNCCFSTSGTPTPPLGRKASDA